ncbi:hypothetical protein ONS95_011009 [Cadophora gregata]|uniref:uncharacterized protein n=1 Tax=Cadophora gregata TaxID=51156 RepID=UPI0026DC90CF|nr:uncharacterized protein ONS95_011009 [Cadophora gregata]KAK0119569.1 hypothetical protein ONS95_011009 [Cadophora gregata]KAK0120605.1 hypothetical protein ONS96_010809 [Cadophora gregata f. sp. sojae]
MESTNYIPTTNNEYSDHQAIRTQIESDVDWDQFWREYNTLNPDYMNNFDIVWTSPPNLGMEMDYILELQAAAETNHLPPSPVGQFELPQYGTNMFLPAYIDPSPTPPWTNPSTSTSSPSATSSRTSNSPSSTSTPSSALSSTTSEGSFSCHFCAQTFAQKCLLNRHINTHTKPYKCSFPDCIERRATNRDLKRHMDVHDPVSAPAFLCTDQGCMYAVKGFKRKDNLKRHVENIHPGLVA